MAGLHNYRISFALILLTLVWLVVSTGAGFKWWRESFAKGVVGLGRDFVGVLTTVTDSAATGSMHSMERVMLNSQGLHASATSTVEEISTSSVKWTPFESSSVCSCSSVMQPTMNFVC